MLNKEEKKEIKGLMKKALVSEGFCILLATQSEGRQEVYSAIGGDLFIKELFQDIEATIHNMADTYLPK